MWFGRILSFSVGFLSLSQEILWIRLLGFATSGLPQAFGFVLGSFLIGIALGAMAGKRCCECSKNLTATGGVVLMFAGFIDLVLPWLAIQALKMPAPAHLLGLAALIAASAFLKSILFPIAHHLGTEASQGKVGVSVSRVYFANILGSTMGPLVTGLVVLQILSLQESFVAVGTLTCLVGFVCLVRTLRPLQLLLPSAALAGTAALAMPFPLVEHLILRDEPNRGPINFVQQSRYGILHTRADALGGDWVYGGNAYDGRVNTDLLVDSNGIQRVYLLAALHPSARNILEIGVGSGSWTAVLAGMPSMDKLTVVEINPGYEELVARYAESEAAMAVPGVELIWSDGRNWLKEQQGAKFDLVVVNTTFHWRAYSTMLLSRDFMELVRAHLADSGIYAFNSTGSHDAFATAQAVFPYVYRFDTFAIAANHELNLDSGTAVRRITQIALPLDKMIDASDPRVLAKIQSMVTGFHRYGATDDSVDAEVITDDNMVVEYRHGSRLRWWK